MSLLVVNAALALAFGARLARLGARDESAATALVRAGLWTCALIVVAQQVLGVAGLLGPFATALALAVANLAALALGRAAETPPAAEPKLARAPWTAFEVGLAAVLLVVLAARLRQGLARESFLYDTLSYHLHAPATWMHDGRLSIVPAVFGDPAPAYAPSNVELVFLFLMAPLRADALAAAGQLPLAALAALAIAATVRESGGARAAALASALAFLLVPEVWQQAPTAMVDVGMAGFLLAALPFLVRLGREVRARDAAALGLALGLAAGSKVVGLVYAAPLAVLAVATLARAKQLRSRAAGAALAAAVVTGGFWYARNFIVTGNPIYPAIVKVGATTLLPGLYDGALLRASDYHVPVDEVGTLLGLLLEAGVGLAAGGAFALVRARRPLWALLAAAFLVSFWLVVPHQESRFLFPLWGVACVALGAPSRTRHPALAWAPLALAVAGGLAEFPTAERWAAVALGGAAGAAGWAVSARLDRRRLVWGAGAGALLAVGALGVALVRSEARDPAYSVGDDLDGPWAWFRAHVRGRCVAYTGNNLPFPLAGAGLANDVRYVNVAGAPDDLAHDFARRAPGFFAKTPEPAPYRDGARYETWRANLHATGREILFIAALYPGVRRSIAADAQGFPVERAWADAHPETFTLRFASPAARVYAVAP